ncbi:MAG: O-antigen ligase family protein [Armatimonadetes bacterium]|nr:O-antigen ligase family protein [Armatimonadota bacterium]
MPVMRSAFSTGVRPLPENAASAIRKTFLNIAVLLLIGAVAASFLFSQYMTLMMEAVIGLAVLAILFARAENGALLVILLMPLMDLYVFPVAGVNFKVSDWIAMLAIAVFFLRLAFDRSLTSSGDALRKPILAYIVIGVVSSLIMMDQIPHNLRLEDAQGLNSPWLRTWTQTFWSVYSFLLYTMVNRVIRTRRILHWAIGALLIVSVIVGLYALSGQRYWTWQGQDFRAIGTFSEPSYYAEWLVLVLPLAIALSMADKIRPGRFAQYGLIFLLVVNLFLTFSTGGFASGLAAIGVVFFLGIRYNLIRNTSPLRLAGGLAIIAICTGLVAAIFVPTVGHELEQVVSKITHPRLSQHSAMVRERAREAAVKMFLDNPILGVGPGNYPFHRLRFMEDDRSANEYELTLRWDPQNLYLEVLSERGLVGGALFAWIWIAYFAALFKGIRQSEDIYTRAVLAGLIASAVGLLIGYWAHANFFRIYIWVQFGIGIAAARLAREAEPVTAMASAGVLGDAADLPDSRRLRRSWRYPAEEAP